MAILDAKTSKVTALGNTYLFGSTIKESVAKSALATFADGGDKYPMLSLTGYINPVQNLNGQSAPYPAGGGKNMLNVTESGVTSSQRCTMTGTEGNLTFTSTGNYGRVGFSISNLTVGNTYTFSCKVQKTVTSGKPSVIYLGTSDWTYNIATLQVSPNGGRDTGDEVSLTKTFTATDSTFFFGVYVTADTGSGDVVKVKDAMLESGGSVTAYAPYSNICPITGWTGMNVTRAGKNLINFPDCESTNTNDINTQYNAPYWDKLNYNYPFKENTQYTFSCQFSTTDTANSWGLRVEYTNGTVAYLWLHNNTTDNNSVTTAANRTIKRINFAYSAAFTLAFSNAQLEEGTTATTFERSGTTYPISWSDEAGTVYGGYLNPVTGVLTVTHYYWTENGTASWNKNADGSFFASYLSPVSTQAAGSVGWCNYCPYVLTFNGLTMFARSNNLMNLGKGWGNLYADTTALKAAFAATPLQVVYPLATPVTYQLDPTEVLSVLGTNNVWVDTNGDVECTYVADTKLYIDSKL